MIEKVNGLLRGGFRMLFLQTSTPIDTPENIALYLILGALSIVIVIFVAVGLRRPKT